MKQLIQNFKTGSLEVSNLSCPSISHGRVLVSNRFSLISAGTERSTVKTGQASLVGKAKERPDLVRQVLQNVRREGLLATYEKVRTRLDSLKALGYSCAGVVLSSMDEAGKFKPGDRVACAGANYASHAELVSVPKTLVAKVPDEVTLAEASFTTLGAIALQGVRQATPRLGDKVCVIGLGLLGQLTCQLLRANGCDVFGIDLSHELVQLAKDQGFKVLSRGDGALLPACEIFTNGKGFDAVIITAATSSNDPIELSAEIARHKGIVVMVGAVGMNIPRDPHFYRKELDLRMSCSYGPGRYDSDYEEGGVDYPFGYVRWTENRNMEAFLGLLAKRAVDVKPLITHMFDISDAETAYDILLGKRKERFIGILLKYQESPDGSRTCFANPSASFKSTGSLVCGFIGAGNFAQSYLIPNVKRDDARLKTVVTSTGINAKNVAGKYGFEQFSTNGDDILDDPEVNTVFIATRHDSHARYAISALEKGKSVFVEKPLAMNEEELHDFILRYAKLPDPRLMVGFNRRFSPLAVKIRNELGKVGAPLMMNFRVNAGKLPGDHWTQSGREGGGRIIGEACHFIDLMLYLTGSLPVRVSAESVAAVDCASGGSDNVAVVIRFKDGSVGNLFYTSSGDKSLPKERLEIYSAGSTYVIDDFSVGQAHASGRCEVWKHGGKGHREEVSAFLRSIEKGTSSPIPFEQLCYTTLVTFKILDSLKTGLPQEIIV